MLNQRKIRNLAVATLAQCVAAAALAAGPSPVLPEHITPETQRAIERGLQYLAESQNANGSWFNAGNMGSYPTAMSSLAGLALLWRAVTRTRFDCPACGTQVGVPRLAPHGRCHGCQRRI